MKRRAWGDISQVADIWLCDIRDTSAVDIRIRLDERAPPAGRVGMINNSEAPTATELPFSGWLGLLKVLDDLLRVAPRADSPETD
jgi:hypothetical protein